MHIALWAVSWVVAGFESAPVSLTAADGTGLALVSYSARAVIEEPLAFTELKLVFQNPVERVIEGQFRIALPERAAVSRFAMKLDGQWQEGEVVEKQAARRAYEDFLHRRQDPTLLEQAQGNEFSARVFPIPAGGQKELVIAFSHALSSAAPFVLPLKGLPQIAKLEVSVVRGGQRVVSLEQSKTVPTQDVTVASGSGMQAVRSGSLLVARVPVAAVVTSQVVTSAVVLVDTSASRALGFSKEVALVKGLVDAWRSKNPQMPVALAAFDQEVAPLYAGPVSGCDAALWNSLKARRALGASDGSKALAWAQATAKASGLTRVVLISDGNFTAGEVEGDQLSAQVARLKSAGVVRLDAVAVGALRDSATLGRLVSGALPSAGVVVEGDGPLDTVVRRLNTATLSQVPMSAPGAASLWPTVVRGAQPGDEVVVVAELANAHAPSVVSVGGVALTLNPRSIERPLIERAWAQARIEALGEQLARAADGDAQKATLRKQIVALSVKHRVLSPYTSLLVLETEADYARFGIDRRALADVMTIEPNGKVALLKRSADSVKTVKSPSQPARSDSREAKKKETSDSDEVEETVETETTKDVVGESMASGAAAKSDVARPVAPAGPPPAPLRQAPAAAAPAEAPAADQAAPLRMRRQGGGGEGAPERRLPYDGPFADVMMLLTKAPKQALEKALGWREEAPADVLALIALGEAYEAAKDEVRAARAYGSIIDLFPDRADLRRFAGNRLERLGAVAAMLAIDTFAKAAANRPDHPASHRLLAFALLRAGQPEKAFEAMVVGLLQNYPEGRFIGVQRILREDLGLIAAAWKKAQPGETARIAQRLQAAGGAAETTPSVRFVLTWETDANDVDFHIFDAKGGHAYYSTKKLPSGGELYDDVTTGYGPECFTVRTSRIVRPYPYKLQAHYYRRGPMGYGMGKLEMVEHDGSGGLAFEQRPFIVMVDGAFVDLGEVKAPLLTKER